jgi:hypothetical protein
LHNISLIVSCCKQGICLVQVITLKMLLSPWFRQTIQNICITNDSRYFPILVSITWSFPHSWLITGFVTRVARRVPLLVHELLAFPENMGSSPVCSGIRVARSLVFCVVIWWSSFVLLSVYLWALCFRSLDLRILITPLFLQTMLIIIRGGIRCIYIFSICILDKPVLVQNKILVQLKIEILKPVCVIIDSKIFWKKTVVLWMKSCSGKISSWLVTEINNKGKRLSSTYLLSLTMIPL